MPQQMDYMAWLQNGDQRGIKYFYDQHYPGLCYFADKIIQNMEASEEIVHDAFVELWKRKQDFRTAKLVKSFLYTVARNKSINYLNVSKREDKNRKELAVYILDETTLANDQVRAELLEQVQYEIEKLSGRRREIFDLFMQGFTEQEIAAQLGISEQTVRSHLHRLIQLLRQILNNRY